MPQGLLDKVEQVFRLIRSKAVGIYLVTQSPTDIPEAILGQLGCKVQHALRAFTPKDQRTIRGVAQGMRNDRGLDVEKAITTLGVGEALVSTLDEKGAPTSVVVATMAPPESRIGAINQKERKENIGNSPIGGRYDQVVDRHSAYELLQARAEENARLLEEEERAQKEAKAREKEARARERASNRRRPAQTTKRGGRKRQSIGEAMLKSAARSVGRSLGSKLVRGLLGSLLK